MWVEDAVHVAIALFDAVSHGGLPHHAAAEENFLPRMPRLGMHQRTHIAVDPRLRVLADSARVDDDAVRALFRVGELIAAALQHAADAL